MPLTTPQTVLVVEDEASIASFVSLYLKNAGYDVHVAETGEDALTKAENQQPSLIVLDLMLPDIDGIEVCRRLRRRSDVPILMLTARDEDVDKIIGLEVGADDYLTKPFNPRELVARVKSIQRRSGPEWDRSRSLEEQSGWTAHAEFMDALEADGFVVLGGPVGDETRALLVIDAESEEEIRDTLGRDPWSGSHLVIESIDSWTIRLGALPA